MSDSQNTSTRPKYTADEREIIEIIRKSKGREPTQQEINLALDQARHLGEID